MYLDFFLANLTIVKAKTTEKAVTMTKYCYK